MFRHRDNACHVGLYNEINKWINAKETMEDISDWTGLWINDAARSAEDRDS